LSSEFIRLDNNEFIRLDSKFIQLKKIKENTNNKNNNALILKVKLPYFRDYIKKMLYRQHKVCKELYRQCNKRLTD
jgi:hypothetical protein